MASFQHQAGLRVVFRPPPRATADRNSAIRESGALRMEKEDLKDRLEEARRKLDEAQNNMVLFFFVPPTPPVAQ